MRTRIVAALLTVGAAALAVGMSATSSFAATKTWTVSPGGAITGKAGTSKLSDTTTGLTVSCSSSDLSGTLKSGSGLSGTGIGTITSITFNNCSVDGFTFTVSSGTVTFPLNFTSYKSSTGVSSGTITGIHIALSSSICDAVLDGTSGTADNGMVKVTYTNKTAKLKVLTSGGNLHVYDVSGCDGLINDGNAGTISATYKITPAQTIST
jgi:hypothetical protein